MLGLQIGGKSVAVRDSPNSGFENKDNSLVVLFAFGVGKWPAIYQ